LLRFKLEALIQLGLTPPSFHPVFFVQREDAESRGDDDLIAMNSPSPQKPVQRKKKGSSVITLNADPGEWRNANFYT
jgi:hypothetical protein